jgi:glutamyl-tRNA synthetase
VSDLLEDLSRELERLDPWSAPAIHGFISAAATAKGLALGKLAQPIRLAVCGGTISTPIDATLEILGRKESLSRLRTAIGRWRAS